MKQLIAVSVLVGMSNLAIAADAPQLRHRFTEYANVVNVQPVYKRVSKQTPAQECWIEHQEQVVTRENSRGRNRNQSNSSQNYRGGDSIIGGIIGGVIGNQLGKQGGRGVRNGATVAGAIIGSVIANEAQGSGVSRHRLENSSSSRSERHQPNRVTTTRPVERCREIMKTTYKRRIESYDVTYQYRGKRFTTRMKRDPGNRIELQVNLAPARH